MAQLGRTYHLTSVTVFPAGGRFVTVCPAQRRIVIVFLGGVPSVTKSQFVQVAWLSLLLISLVPTIGTTTIRNLIRPERNPGNDRHNKY